MPLERRRRRACARSVSAPGNALAIDDEAVAWMASSAVLDVVVVSDPPGPGPFAELLQRDPGVKVTLVASVATSPADGRDDLRSRPFRRRAPARPALGHRAASVDLVRAAGV